MTDHIKWVTAWHEVVHGILEHAGMSDHKEEMVCFRLWNHASFKR
jgi:hypothetical protein